jgi:hypothetical protein
MWPVLELNFCRNSRFTVHCSGSFAQESFSLNAHKAKVVRAPRSWFVSLGYKVNLLFALPLWAAESSWKAPLRLQHLPSSLAVFLPSLLFIRLYNYNVVFCLISLLFTATFTRSWTSQLVPLHHQRFSQVMTPDQSLGSWKPCPACILNPGIFALLCSALLCISLPLLEPWCIALKWLIPVVSCSRQFSRRQRSHTLGDFVLHCISLQPTLSRCKLN